MVIRETTGRRTGLFSTREAAMRFARDESASAIFTESLELVERARFSRAA